MNLHGNKDKAVIRPMICDGAFDECIAYTSIPSSVTTWESSFSALAD
jgi:hypothetical protein